MPPSLATLISTHLGRSYWRVPFRRPDRSAAEVDTTAEEFSDARETDGSVAIANWTRLIRRVAHRQKQYDQYVALGTSLVRSGLLQPRPTSSRSTPCCSKCLFCTLRASQAVVYHGVNNAATRVFIAVLIWKLVTLFTAFARKGVTVSAYFTTILVILDRLSLSSIEESVEQLYFFIRILLNTDGRTTP